jgi:hypothetical protein
VAQNIMPYDTKEIMEMTMKYMYMALSTPNGLEIWIDEGRPVDMCSRCSVEKLTG